LHKILPNSILYNNYFRVNVWYFSLLRMIIERVENGAVSASDAVTTMRTEEIMSPNRKYAEESST